MTAVLRTVTAACGTKDVSGVNVVWTVTLTVEPAPSVEIVDGLVVAVMLKGARVFK